MKEYLTFWEKCATILHNEPGVISFHSGFPVPRGDVWKRDWTNFSRDWKAAFRT